MPVSPLRRDVRLLASGPGDDGAPEGLLYDAFHDTFDKFGWREREVLRRMTRPMRLGELHRSLCEQTCIGVSLEELAGFVRSLHSGGLLQSFALRTPDEFLGPVPSGGRGTLSRLFVHYLFFRVPLFRPDGFLRKTMWIPALCGSVFARILFWTTAAALPFLLVPRLGMLKQSITPFISFNGAVWFSLALIAVKIIHEFSHAYAAAKTGIGVRSMGVTFMMLFPVPYCDVTHAWRLNRRQRFTVDFAGVRAELVVGLLALCFWCLAEPGAARDSVLFLGTASVFSTILTNLNPGVRFDGYYLMSDLTGIDNLGNRSLAILRHGVHRALLGVAEEKPDAGVTGRKRLLLAAYAAYAALYRIGLYFGLALLVYDRLPKFLGILMFAAEILFFLVRPVVRESKMTFTLLRNRGMGFRPLLLLAALTVFLLWFILPLPRTIRLDAAVSTDAQIVLRTPDPGRIVVNNLKRGATIAKGDLLFSLDNDDLNADIRLTELKLAEAGMLLDMALRGPGGKERLRDSLAGEERLKSLLASFQIRKSMLTLRSPADCLVLDAEPAMIPGTYLGKGVTVGRILPVSAPPRITAYVSESDVDRIVPGGGAVFVSAADPMARHPGRITEISPVNSESIEEPALAAPHGGTIPILPRPGLRLAPAIPLYRVGVRLSHPCAADLRPGQIGEVRAEGKPVSLALKTWEKLVQIALRESGP